MSLRKLIKLAIELDKSSQQYHSPAAVAARERERQEIAKELKHKDGSQKIQPASLNQILGR